ncbi:hypothetical protein LPJ66_008217 [Kickxella alabastrina]|uniref:Uncharacterized protein n=1 Tax=Kickxella alabastrina TaxID=61397 RepID=A0ACC1IAB2_9FUNG|nr:hypothetical protein LPJ66_008217 [Kickxella alabastrina]
MVYLACSRDPEWKKEFVRNLNIEHSPATEHFPPIALSTVDLNGRPSVRMVSPRGFLGDGFLKTSATDQQNTWTSDILTLCTHAQSNKVQELLNTPDTQLVCWLPRAQAQIRCSGRAHLLFHPESPLYSTLTLDLEYRVWPSRQDNSEDVAGDDVPPVVVDPEFVREQAFLHHSPGIQSWYSWPAPGRARALDDSLYPKDLERIEDSLVRDRCEETARRNYVLVFIDIDHVDIVDLGQSTRRIYTRRSDNSWTTTNVNP